MSGEQTKWSRSAVMKLAALALEESNPPQYAVLNLLVAAVRVAKACDRVDATKPVPGLPITREMLDEFVDEAWQEAQRPREAAAGRC